MTLRWYVGEEKYLLRFNVDNDFAWIMIQHLHDLFYKTGRKRAEPTKITINTFVISYLVIKFLFLSLLDGMQQLHDFFILQIFFLQ